MFTSKITVITLDENDHIKVQDRFGRGIEITLDSTRNEDLILSGVGQCLSPITCKNELGEMIEVELIPLDETEPGPFIIETIFLS